jgi:hypothetical protein
VISDAGCATPSCTCENGVWACNALPCVSLTVTSATSPATLAGVTPSGGDFFLVVDLMLKNTSSSVPLSTAKALFSLETTQALVLTAAPEQPSSACSGLVSVAVGGQFECGIAFEVPAGQTPATLLYDDMRGHMASAPVPMIVTTPDAGAFSDAAAD